LTAPATGTLAITTSRQRKGAARRRGALDVLTLRLRGPDMALGAAAMP
jgi:hypothetical protein